MTLDAAHNVVEVENGYIPCSVRVIALESQFGVLFMKILGQAKSDANKT